VGSPSQPTSYPLLGERGLLPVSRFTQFVSFRASPSLFFFWPTDTRFVLRLGGHRPCVLALIGWATAARAIGLAVVWVCSGCSTCPS